MTSRTVPPSLLAVNVNTNVDDEVDEASFAALRERGMVLLRGLCGEVWTDHNLHDPGITLLELVCHGITDLCYRIDRPIGELLGLPEGQPPEGPRPARPVGAEALAQQLLDEVAGLRGLDLAPRRSLPDRGLYRATVWPATGPDLQHDPARLGADLRALRAAWRATRPLGEDLEPGIDIEPSGSDGGMPERRSTVRPGQASLVPAARPDPGPDPDAGRYASLQDELPAVYGLGAEGLPSSATPQRRAAAQQLRGYLALIEQPMADRLAQLAHLPRILAVDDAPVDARAPLDERAMPGLSALWQDRSDEPRLVSPQPAPVERRIQALDHLLALEGMTLDDELPAACLAPYTGQERSAQRLRRRLGWMRHAPALARDRATGADLSRHPWHDEAGTPAVQRRLGLLLGLQDPQARSLTQDLRREQALVERQTVSADEAFPGESLGLVDAGLALGLTPDSDTSEADLDGTAPADVPQALHRHLARLDAWFVAATTDAAWRRMACHFHGYRWQPLDADQPGQAGRLLLLAADRRQALPLADLATRAEAGRLAGWLRQRQLDRDRAASGLHLIEHVLLRPLGDSPSHQRLTAHPAWRDDWHALRHSVVLPAWTLWGHEPGYRRHAAGVVRRACPVHLRPALYWLDAVPMRRLDLRLDDWLQVRVDVQQRHDHRPDLASLPDADRERLNRAAARLVETLLDAAFMAVEPA